jgi:hypothetical protein
MSVLVCFCYVNVPLLCFLSCLWRLTPHVCQQDCSAIIYNNHASTALCGLGPPLASSFRGYWVVRICGSWWLVNWPRYCSIDPDLPARAIWQAVRRLEWEMEAIWLTRKVLLHAVNLRHGNDEGSCATDFYHPQKSIDLGRDRTREPWVQWRAR